MHCSRFSFIILGDFNLPHISWDSLQIACSDGIHDKFLLSFMQEGLTQMIRQPTRHKAILDIILVPDSLLTSPPNVMPPICDLDHAAQTIEITTRISDVTQFHKCPFHHRDFSKTDFQRCVDHLSQIDWVQMFNKCTDFDDYMPIFAKLLSSTLDLFTPWKKQYNKHRVRFPKYIMKLIHKKRRLSKSARKIGDYSAYRICCLMVKKSISDFHYSEELKIINGKNRTVFYSYVNNKPRRRKRQINYLRGNYNKLIYDEVTMAEMFTKELSKNFNESDVATAFQPGRQDGLLFKCTPEYVREAISCLRISASGSDCISAKQIEGVAPTIFMPLVFICQQTFHQGKFPSMLKAANVCPIYKRK